ncbi:MAG TPA: AbrB/MazE/SpoVT family DNA-binding domain-containing protein [Caulobacteraceae bacterium]|jgi:hypothetical protein|nr:AbrB/MazE/SpoVT family DNA-binding domain-containing protein [Caulobacteraceae bacterium]
MNPDPEKMAAIATPQATVSDKIRALGAAGYARADIARFLGKRYQHVRNVLEDDAQRGGGYTLGRADLSGVQEGPRAFDRDEYDAYLQARSGGNYRLVVRPDGSILIPKEMIGPFKAGPGGVLIGRLDGETFSIVSVDTAIREVQEAVKKYAPKDGSSVVDRFLAERRAMWGERDDD